jgi:PKD repeat protein
VLLAYPVKQNPTINNQLPNAGQIRDRYFDQDKDGQVLPDGSVAPRIDSHAEWWEEISYGDVTVSGNVFGWALLPWRTMPPNVGDLGPGAVGFATAPHINLINGATYRPGEGEDFFNDETKFRYDFDGVGGTADGGQFRNFAPVGVNAGLPQNPNSDLRAPFRRIHPKGSITFDYSTEPPTEIPTEDALGFPIWMPGERFLDLNNNRIYDAGVFEWGIDKNNNGMIDVDKKASSWSELFDACIQLPREEQGTQGEEGYLEARHLAFLRWNNDTEWFDSNGDGRWNADNAWQNPEGPGQVPWRSPDAPGDATDLGITFSEWWPAFNDPGNCPDNGVGGTPTLIQVRFFRGDWGGTEPFIDINEDGRANSRGVQTDEYREYFGRQANESRPATVFEWLQSAKGHSTTPDQPVQDASRAEYFDEQWNGQHDFPEPFEDYLRYWNPQTHQFEVLDDEEYIRNNFPGSEATMLKLLGDRTANPPILGRIGNHRYDAPDRWNNNGSVGSSNKMQEIINGNDPADAVERAEYTRRSFITTPPPSAGPATGGAGAPWSLQEMWDEYFSGPAPQETENTGPTTPDWRVDVPYMRRFDPANPVIPLVGDAEPRRFAFRATGGGPRNDGTNENFIQYTETMGTVLPDPADPRDGLYDAPAEYADLPSSIYHQAGDGQLGEITSPANDAFYGQDIGLNNPNSPGGEVDNIIRSAGPLAYGLHGNNGQDAGNQFSLELLTWRRNGGANADGFFEGPTGPAVPRYRRDINLDGLLDLGETVGEAGLFGAYTGADWYTYGVSPVTGQPANGNPSNFYPHNRTRAMEDTVEILDAIVDWDDFLGGPGAFGNRVLGLLLMPETTGPNGMFTLPASGEHLIRTLDRIDATKTGRDRYVPISFFDGMGIAIGEDGEGGGLGSSTFQIGFAGHEYGHIWESWPDLYDYDVRAVPPLNIVNNPVGAWCVMAGGGLVHPVPILKEQSGWISPVDITRALSPGQPEIIRIRPWEFDRNRTVFTYSNPLAPDEKYWFWVTSAYKPNSREVNFDAFSAMDPTHGLPGLGLMIMRTDIDSNSEALPPQQRIAAGRFAYQIIQADGDEALENGENFGDAGDPFPGTTNKRRFARDTDPSSRWGDGEWTGLEITNIQIDPVTGAADVTFNWTPTELPTLTWVRPSPFGQPGNPGESVGGNYQLRTVAYDQFGGTTIEFYVAPYVPPGEPRTYNGASLGSTTKFPGERIVNHQISVSGLSNGVYTFYAKLVPGAGQDDRMEAEASKPRGAIENAGDGELTLIDVDTDISFFERWTIRCVSASPPGAEKWSVVGTISGEQVAQAVTGQDYTSDTGAVKFRIDAHTKPFAVGDEFAFLTTGLTSHSSAVLVNNGEIVTPQDPVAAARIVSSSNTGLAPFTVSFKHDESFDPLDVSLTWIYDFGDGSLPYTTTDPDEIVTHTFTQARALPYQVMVRVVNIFGNNQFVTLPVQVNTAAAPNVNLQAAPRSGDVPLTVHFSGEGTSDPNPQTQSLDYVWDFGDGSPIATTPQVDHTYTTAGVFIARLTVTNRPYGVSATRQVEIRAGGSIENDLPPIAQIDVDKTRGAAPLTILFNGDGSIDPEGGVLDYHWTFGDGGPDIRGSSTVERRFTVPGDYRVTLTVTDPAGQRDDATIVISVQGDVLSANQAPLARIRASTRQGAAPLTVRLDGSESADPEGGALTYTWNFGDGSPEVEGVSVEYTYRTAQSYIATLRVRDPQGAEGVAAVNILVNAAAGQVGQNPPGSGGLGGDNPAVPACAAGCGPLGLMPMAFLLVGIGGLRRLIVPRRR